MMSCRCQRELRSSEDRRAPRCNSSSSSRPSTAFGAGVEAKRKDALLQRSSSSNIKVRRAIIEQHNGEHDPAQALRPALLRIRFKRRGIITADARELSLLGASVLSALRRAAVLCGQWADPLTHVSAKAQRCEGQLLRFFEVRFCFVGATMNQ